MDEIKERKAMVYDLSLVIQQAQAQIVKLNQEIEELVRAKQKKEVGGEQVKNVV